MKRNHNYITSQQVAKRRIRTIIILFSIVIQAWKIHAKGPLYRVYALDSNQYQYKVTLIRVSNQDMFTIYTFKDANGIQELINKGHQKIEIGNCYRLRFKERLMATATNLRVVGDRIHYFYIDRLEGLYYDPFPRSVFKKSRWKPKKNKHLDKTLKEKCILP
jgi:hypothetical protein